jgi:Lysozyme like domain
MTSAPVTRWSSQNWTPGKVTLFNALGLGSWNVRYPALTPSLAGAVAQDSAAGSNGTSTTANTTSAQPVPGGGQYSFAQLEALWVQAGGNPAVQAMAAAIAMAESGGKVNATDDDSNGSQDRGLWQINSSHGSQSVFTPLKNAQAAVAISANGTNWSPWVTYQNGDYKQFLP